MELQKLRYFHEAAEQENIHKASKVLHISAAAISKAIAALEAELDVQLFERRGRSIVLTDAGRLLKTRSAEILDLEKGIRAELTGGTSALTISVCGREFLLSQFGLPFVEASGKTYKTSSFVFRNASGEDAFRLLNDGSCDFAITIQKPDSDLKKRKIGEFELKTAVGKGHPLYARVARREKIAIEEILSYDFASPNTPMYGRIQHRRTIDGWRDDVFPRRVKYQVENVAVLSALVERGLALAYVPDFWIDGKRLLPVEILNCSFFCRFDVWLSTKKPEQSGWKKSIFEGDF